MTSRVWTITVPQQRWIKDTTERFGVSSTDLAEALIKNANQQSVEVKKYIFRVVRCSNCGSGALRGGLKTEHVLSLEGDYIKYLELVQAKCDHASLDKTLRIILDYYIGKCAADAGLLAAHLLRRPELAGRARLQRRSDALAEGRRLFRRAMPRADEDEGHAEGPADAPLEHRARPTAPEALALLAAALRELEESCTGAVAEEASAEEEATHLTSAHRYRGLVLAGLSRDAEALEAFDASLAAAAAAAAATATTAAASSAEGASSAGSGAVSGHAGVRLARAACLARLGRVAEGLDALREAAALHYPNKAGAERERLLASEAHDPRRRS